jgi:hypothetical protein
MRIHLTALLAVAGCSLAACGGDDGTPAAGAERPGQSTRQAMADFAQCMRENGVDVPDPGSGERGSVRVEGDPEDLREAEEACAEYREEIKPPDLSDEQSEELKQAALAHARCMREQGIDFPDPQFGADGGAMVQIGPGSGIDFEDPDFREAQEACRDELPELRMEQSP